jgi:nitrogen fixation NifU-like protein
MDIVSAEFFDHFMHPRNVGVVDDPDGVGKWGDPGRGDYLVVMIKVEKDVIRDIKFLCKCCPEAIAISSVITEMVKEKHLGDVLKITVDQVEAELGGLPEYKHHCSMLSIEALKAAVLDYNSRR